MNCGTHVFFRLLSSTLSAKKRPRTDRNIALNHSQFCIQRHVVQKVDVASKQVHVALQEADGAVGVEMWERPESTRMLFLKWKVLRHYHAVRGANLHDGSQQALDFLLSNHAVSAGATVDVHGQGSVLQGGMMHLQQLDVA